eukprot:scaffold1630_cov298-Prasinococcus_capsulatus_cf.AAC.3
MPCRSVTQRGGLAGVETLPNFNRDMFPSWARRDLREVVPDLEPAGVDLLSKMLVYEPTARISARLALAHPYFDDLSASGASPMGAAAAASASASAAAGARPPPVAVNGNGSAHSRGAAQAS